MLVAPCWVCLIIIVIMVMMMMMIMKMIMIITTRIITIIPRGEQYKVQVYASSYQAMN